MIEPPLPKLNHLAGAGAVGHHHAGQIDRHHFLPVLDILVGDERRRPIVAEVRSLAGDVLSVGDAGRRDNDIEPAKLVDTGLRRRVVGGFGRGIALHDDSAPAQRFNRGHRVGRALRQQVGQQDVGAFLRESNGAGRTDPACSSGNQRCLTLKCSCHDVGLSILQHRLAATRCPHSTDGRIRAPVNCGSQAEAVRHDWSGMMLSHCRYDWLTLCYST